MPFAERGSSFADEGEGDASMSLTRERHRNPGDREGADRQRCRGRKDPPLPVADMHIEAIHRRTALDNRGVQHHPYRRGVLSHRECNAEVADDWSDDVTLPS